MEITIQCEEPLCKGDLLVKTSAFLSHKWRRRYVAVFARGRLGVARLELFRNVEDYARGNTERIILLSGCVAVQLVHDERERRSTLKLHLSNGTFSFQSAHFDDLQKWQRFISEAAFGDFNVVQKAKLPNPGDQPVAIQTRSVAPLLPELKKETAIHVSLLSSTAQSFAPGNYSLTFTDEGFCLSAEMATLRMEIFHFDRIAWLGRGVGCLAFQLRNGHLFELTSERADAIARYIQHRASLNPTTRKPSNLRLQYDSSLDAFQADEYNSVLLEEAGEASGSVLNSWRKLKATLKNRFKSHKIEDQSSEDSSEVEQADMQWVPRRGGRQITRSFSERLTPPAGHFRPNPLYLESIRSSGFFSAESQIDEPSSSTRKQFPYREDSYRKVKASRNSAGELSYVDGQSLGSVITDV